jgi:hypothetical protein
MYRKFWLENVEERDRFEDLGVNERMMLNGF